MIPYISISQSCALTRKQFLPATGVFDYSSTIFSTSYPSFGVWKVQPFTPHGVLSLARSMKLLRWVMNSSSEWPLFSMQKKTHAEVQSLSSTKETSTGKSKGKAREESLCPACGWSCSAKMHLPLRGPSRAVPMPGMEIPGHAWSSLLCEDARSVRRMGNPPAGCRNQIWRNKRGFGSEQPRSCTAKAGLLVLLCSFVRWNISALCLTPFNEGGETVGNGLQPARWKRKRHAANSRKSRNEH